MCKSIGCGPGGGNGKASGWAWIKNKVQRSACGSMDCDDVDIGAVLVGSVVVDLAKGLAVAVNVTFDRPLPEKTHLGLGLATRIAGLDDATSWQISSSFLSSVASAARSALGNVNSLANFMSIDTDDLTRVVALLDAIGVDADHTSNTISVTKFLAAMDSATLGAFIQKAAGADLDDFGDLGLDTSIPPLPVQSDCHAASWQERPFESFNADHVEAFLARAPGGVNFTVPPLCKVLSDETRGWIKSVQLWDMSVNALSLVSLDASMEPPTAAIDLSTVSVGVAGLHGEIRLTFRVEVWGLGIIESAAVVTLNGYAASVVLPIQGHATATLDAAKVSVDERKCSLSSSSDSIEIVFETDGFYLGEWWI